MWPLTCWKNIHFERGEAENVTRYTVFILLYIGAENTFDRQQAPLQSSEVNLNKIGGVVVD